MTAENRRLATHIVGFVGRVDHQENRERTNGHGEA
jgi:hypothetical protein